MSKTRKGLLIAGVVLLVAILAVLAVLLFILNSRGQESQKPASEDMDYTVLVKNATDVPLEGIGVYIYEDETQAELVWFDKTNVDGEMFFTAPESDEYVAVLGNIPTGYGAEEFYPITGEETEIILYAGVMSDEDMQSVTYKLGDVMMDFTIIDTEGNEYTLSELLKEKKAVVLNFWYLSCQPCRNEFPFMQEAYEKYKDDIEILAMNPVDMDEAAVAAFKKELGLTFPMAVVDQLWAQMLQLTAYPTTVVIDRFGNISLIHKGSIDSADTFEQLFEYFAAEDYEQRAIQSIDEVVTKDEGSEENPMTQGGAQNFNVTVGGGETYYLDLYKITGKVYLTVKGEDFTLTYNGKNYDSQNGSLTITITSEGPSTPVKLAIKNNTDKEQTYSVSLAAPKGTLANPYSIALGEFAINTEAGNEQGVYGTYRAENSGTLTVRCLYSSVSKYGFYLYNLRSYAMRNADEDSVVDEDGYVTVSVQVKKGDEIQFSVAVARDDSNYIAAGSFRFELSLVEGDGEEKKEPEPPKTEYSVVVTDENGNPISGVVINFKGEFTYEPTEEDPEDLKAKDVKVDTNLTTDETGTVKTEQINGPYTVTVRIPDGYKLATTKYDLTAETPTVTIKLQSVVYANYSVKVTDPDGNPVADTIVIVGGSVVFTDSQGTAAFKLEEGSYTALVLGIPSHFILEQDTFDFPENSTTLTVQLDHGPGHETNPIEIREQVSIETGTLEGGKTVYYTVYDVAGSTLSVADSGAYVLYNGTKLTANPEGVISVDIPEDTESISLAVGNTGSAAKSYTVNFTFPVGTYQNPDTGVTNIARLLIKVPEGEEEGYYYSWTPTENGTLTVNCTTAGCDVILHTGDKVEKLSESDTSGKVTIEVKKGVPVLIQGVAVPDADGNYPAVRISASGVFTKSEAPEGTTYTVTVKDASDIPQANVQVQFMKDGVAVGDPVATDSSGVAEAVLEAGSYTVTFVDADIVYDAQTAVVTEETPAVTITVSWPEDPVPEGMTRYSVTVTDYNGNLIPDIVVLFLQDGATAGYSIVGESGGTVSVDLETGTYQVQLAFIGDQEYYYEQSDAEVTEAAPSRQILVASPATAETMEHWSLGFVTPVEVGGTSVKMQADIINYYVFEPTEQGVYKIAISNPDAVLSYWGDINNPMDITETLEDYADNSFTRSINTNALGQSVVIGITGAEECILIITREGDAEEDVPFVEYEPATPPTAFTMSSSEGNALVKVDLKASTDTYQLVLGSDGYYHLGAADGPIMYVQLTFNNVNPDAPVEPAYIHLLKMVGGVDNTGTALRCIETDADGNETLREDYTACMLAFGECVDPTYGVYPLTEDLMYMIQKGGTYQGWWDPENQKGNLLFADSEGNLDTSINLEIAWMFACCYVPEN